MGIFLGWKGFSLIIIITLSIFICILIYWLLYRSKLRLLTVKIVLYGVFQPYYIGIFNNGRYGEAPPMDLAFEDKVVGRLNGEVIMNVTKQTVMFYILRMLL